mmetsp:Transcript_34287/g.110085  ORF Transcript_34287/g.110085 Transcript_34287/m.110085 type:complete len:225 (+) Transcript_34287:2725-3399(+)
MVEVGRRVGGPALLEDGRGLDVVEGHGDLQLPGRLQKKLVRPYGRRLPVDRVEIEADDARELDDLGDHLEPLRHLREEPALGRRQESRVLQGEGRASRGFEERRHLVLAEDRADGLPKVVARQLRRRTHQHEAQSVDRQPPSAAAKPMGLQVIRRRHPRLGPRPDPVLRVRRHAAYPGEIIRLCWGAAGKSVQDELRLGAALVALEEEAEGPVVVDDEDVRIDA